MKSTLLFTIILLIQASPVFASISSTTGNIHFDINNTTQMTLNSNGLGVGTSSPSSNLYVQGNTIISKTLSIGNTNSSQSNLHIHGTLGYSLKKLSSSANVENYSYILADPATGGANITLNLPYAGNVDGQIMTIKQISTGNSVTLQSPGSTIDGRSLLVSTGNSMGHISLISSANQWFTLSSSSDWSQETIQSISGLSMWYDAADLDGDGTEEGSQESGYSTATGGNIVQWSDKSGNNYHLSGNGTYPTPGYHQETQNGRSVVTNTSGNMLVYGGGVPDMDGWSVFLVFKPTAWPGAEYYIFSCDDNRNKFIYTSTGNISTENTSNRNFFSSSQNFEVDGVTTSFMTLNTYNLLYAEAHSGHAARNAFLFLNRETCDRGAIGSIAEVIFYNRTLSSDERKLVEGYLKYKWNLSTLID